MKDKRPVGELSTAELEQILLIRKREERMQRFRGGGNPNDERRLATAPPALPVDSPTETPPAESAVWHENTQALEEIPPAYVDYPDDGAPRFEDELPPRYVQIETDKGKRQSKSGKPAPSMRRRITNVLLLGVEVLAVIGLGALLIVAYEGVQTVNRNIEKTDSISATSEAELVARRIQPTATPLITVNQVVLPGGHVWDAGGNHRFNLNEIPGPYRPAYEQNLSAPRAEFRPIPEGGPVSIQIPDLNLEATVRAGDDWISLQAGVGHHPGSANPGVNGNMVLTGHNDIYGEIFRHLPELELGAEIRVQSTRGQWYTYVVEEKIQVDPSEVWVLGQELGQETPLVTLITCYPYRVNTHRMIVFARLVS